MCLYAGRTGLAIHQASYMVGSIRGGGSGNREGGSKTLDGCRRERGIFYEARKDDAGFIESS